MAFRSKSSHPASIETQIEKMRISDTIRTYSKYIQHVPIIPPAENTA
jgi:hypothetical protein